MQHVLNWTSSLPTWNYLSTQPNRNLLRLGFPGPFTPPECSPHLLPRPASGASWHQHWAAFWIHLLLSFLAPVPLAFSSFLTWILALIFWPTACCPDRLSVYLRSQSHHSGFKQAWSFPSPESVRNSLAANRSTSEPGPDLPSLPWSTSPSQCS